MHYFTYKDILIFWHKIQLPLILLCLTFFGGTLGFKLLYPEESWSRLFFMTAITISTVGYTDVLGVEKSQIASWYTMLLIIVGMGLVLYSVSILTAYIVEGNLGKLFLERRMRHKISELKDHYIICGAGQTGIHVIDEIRDTRHEYVVIENDPEIKAHLLDEFPNSPVIDGDATSDEVLTEAGIKQARGLVAALASDKDNLFLTLSARILNRDITIVSRAIDLSIKRKLLKAGANYIVSPNHIGGLRMASEILRPHVVTFLDRMLRGRDPMRIEELTVNPDSSAINKTLRQMAIPEKTGLLVIATTAINEPHHLVYNPGPEQLLQSGSVIYFIGTPEQQKTLSNLIN